MTSILTGVLAGGTLAAPPLLDNAIVGSPVSGSTHDLSTAGLDVTDARVFPGLAWSSSPTFSSFSGLTDDTSASLRDFGSTPKGSLREMTIASALDATWRLTTSASTRAVLSALSVTDTASVVTPAVESGTGAALPGTSSTAIGSGPHNCLVFLIAWVQGAHVTNPFTAPTDWSLVAQAASGTDDPSSTTRVTLAIAQRTFSSISTVPAATFGGLADIASQPWRAQLLICLPS